jgi:hypothetical protein
MAGLYEASEDSLTRARNGGEEIRGAFWWLDGTPFRNNALAWTDIPLSAAQSGEGN